MSYESLRIDVSGPVATVTLTGPGKGNAMGPEFWREVPEAFRSLDAKTDVRAIIVRGSGEHFSYGLDLPRMMGELGTAFSGGGMARDRLALFDLITRMQDSVSAVEQCKKPVIAAVTGWCIGGGVDLIAACDIRLCSSDAKFSVREVKVAMVADIGSLQRLPRIIGEGHTRELAFTGKNIDAARALRIGLVNDTFETHDDLFSGAQSLAMEIAENSPLVVNGIKRVMNACDGKSIADGLHLVAQHNAACLPSTDLAEALAAFAEKRPARFAGQ